MAGVRRWVQVQDGDKFRLVEVDSTYRPRQRSMSDTDRLVSESHYEGMTATDGTPIDSRQRHKAYMRERGVCHAGDFTPEWLASRRKEIAREQVRERKRQIIDVVTRHER